MCSWETQDTDIAAFLADARLALGLADPDEVTPEEAKAAIARSITRKIKEMRYALALEKTLTKDQILELYMNQIYLGQHLPRNLMGRLLTSMAPVDRDKVREVIRYGKHTVGAMMDFELITVRPDVTLATVQRYLRLRGKLYLLLQRNALRAPDQFEIPPNRVIELGTQVEI